MSERTKIAWCDSTVNFWSGCTKVSAGCQNCYAEELSHRFGMSPEKTGHIGLWGKGAPRRFHESAAKMAHRLNKKPWVCDKCGVTFTHLIGDSGNGRNIVCPCGSRVHRRRVFSLSLGDWLDPEVPVEWLARMLDTIRLCPDVTWILVTKRPELFPSRMTAARNYAAIEWDTPASEFMHDWIHGGMVGDWSPSNIIVMASVENQETTVKRVPALLSIPAVCRGLSIEPLLEPVDVAPYFTIRRFGGIDCDQWLHWLVIGGESGTKSRPCNVEWIRSLVGQGKSAGVPVFVKQTGSLTIRKSDTPETLPNGELGFHHHIKTFHPKGGDPSEWPEYLRVREWPKL